MDQTDWDRVEIVELFPAPAAGGHQPGLLQHPQVLHDAEAGQGKPPDEGAERLAVVLEERVQEGAAGGVGEGLEDEIGVHERQYVTF